MAGNPFDQFDNVQRKPAASGNPFDQFDAPAAVHIPEYQPGVAWREQPYEFRSMYEQKAEEELAGQFEKQVPFDLAGALYGRPSVNAGRAPITAEAVSKRAEAMARENNFKPGFGGGSALDENKVTGRTIMNAGNPGMMFGSQGVWDPVTWARSGDELFDVSEPKMGMGEAIAKGGVDIAIATPGVKSISAGALNAMGTRNEDGSPKSAADLGGEWDAEAAKALRDRPASFRGGQFGAVIAGTPMKALYEGTANALPRLVAPSIRAASGPGAKLGGRVAAHSIAGATDFAAISALTEPQNRAREDGGSSADVTMGQRLGEFGNQMNPLKSPINYAFGPANLAVSRVGHAAVNTPRASIEASRAAGGPRIAIGQATPKAVQARQALEPKGIPSFGEMRDSYARSLREDGAGTNQTVLRALENTPILKKFVTEADNGVALPEGMSQDRFDAIKHVLKRGLDPDQIEQYVNLYNYSKAGSVEEALGLLSNSSKIDSLNVALANIPGDAQAAWRDFFEVFKEGSPEVIQRYLRQATGIDAADYAGYVKGLREKRVSEPAPLYEAAAGKQVKPETWENQILPAFLRFDGAPKTIREAAGQTASLGKPGTAEAAQELYRFADELEAIRKQAAESGFAGGLLPSGSLSELSQSAGSQIATPRQLSSRALIELDQFLGGEAQNLSKTAPQLAGSVRNTQNEIRGTGRTTGLDPETGANLGRDRSQKFKVAEEATQFGYDSFKNGKTLRSLVDDFRLTNKEEIDSLAQASILMGWVRAAEDQIESSGNASQVINRLYGSANQRKKLLEMLPKAAEDATAAEKAAITRQTKAMMGGRVTGYDDPLPSIFERQRNVLKAEKRMTGGSPTTPKGTAILGESELSGLIDGVIDTVLNPKRAIQEGARKAIHTVWKPAIMKEGVNRELGNILTTTGAKNIKKTLAEIRQVRDAPKRASPMNKALTKKGPGGSGGPKGPVRGAGFMLPEKSGRPIGFHDDLPRGTKRFHSDKLTASQNKSVEMARNGYSNAEIAEEMAISANAVSVHLRNARLRGVDSPASRTGKQPTTRTDILRAAESGANATAIAERLGISPVQVRVTLSRARKAVQDAGRELPDWLKPRSAGIDVGSEFSQLGVGTGLGAQGAQDLDGDGKISFAERAAGAAAGYGVIKGGPRAIAAAGRVGPRIGNRLAGTRNPKLKDVNKGRDAYTFDLGETKADVLFDKPEYPNKRLGKLGDSVEVNMEISMNAGESLPLPQVKRLFEKTFAAVEDHAVRYNRPVYNFAGHEIGHYKLYENTMRRRGAPPGYVGITGKPSGPGGIVTDLEDNFYIVRKDVFEGLPQSIKSQLSVIAQGRNKAARDNGGRVARGVSSASVGDAGVRSVRRPVIEGMTGVEGNVHGLSQHLRVNAGKRIANRVAGQKPMFTQVTNNKNAPAQIENLDILANAHPDAGASTKAWNAMMADALGTADVPAPPYAFIRDINGDGASKLLKSMNKGQIADANAGISASKEMRRMYTNGEMSVDDTGKIFLWSFLSRGVSPYTQESLFLDSILGIDKWIKHAADGTLKKNMPAFNKWAAGIAPKGSGVPGAGAKHNLNGYGKNFLIKMSEPAYPGANYSRLQHLHNMISDPNMTGKQIRREFLRMSEGVGIDNKVVSFSLLVSGFDDIMVLDRVQVRQMWNDGRFDGMNLYDGFKEGKNVVTGSALSNLTYGARGLAVYESAEAALAKNLKRIYAEAGRPGEESVGRYHWDTWVASSNQEAGHGTIDIVRKNVLGDKDAIYNVRAKNGEYGEYTYGAMYGKARDGTDNFQYDTGNGTYQFKVDDFGRFIAEVKKPKNGVVPKKFKVSEAGNEPWYNKEGVNREKIKALAEKYGQPIGVPEGYGPVRGAETPVRRGTNRPGEAGGQTVQKGPIVGAGFIGGKPPKPPKSRLGRGLDDLVNDKPPVRSNPPKKPQAGSALAPKPRSVANWSDAERKAFINSGHEEGLIPIEPPSSFQTIKDARKSMKRLGVDYKAGSKNDYEGGFPVMASLLAAGGVTAGTLGILASHLNQKPKSNVPPALAKERASLADRAATAYQKDPNGDEFRNTMIRLQQVDRQIEEATGDKPGSDTPRPPSHKPLMNTALGARRK